MANTRRLFRNIWRINAVIILIAGVILALAALAGLYEIVTYATRDRTIRNVVLPDGPTTETRLTIGSFEVLRGVPGAIAPYRRQQNRRQQGYTISSYSKSAASVVDYFIVNTKDGSSWRVRGEDRGIVAQRWLLAERSSNLIVPGGAPAGSSKSVPTAAGSQVNSRPIALIVVSVASADTNGDDRVTASDRKHLIAATPDGSLKRRIAENIEQVLLLTLRDGALRLIFREAETQRVVLRIIDPTNLTALSEYEVARN